MLDCKQLKSRAASQKYTWRKTCFVTCLLALWYSQNMAVASEAYSAASKIQIPGFTVSGDYRIVREEAGWLYVRFDTPTVPVWVSESFVDLQGSRALVHADRVNGRLAPSLTSPVLTRINTGYSSVVDDRAGGFVKLRAPNFLVVAIRANGVSNSRSASQGISQSNTATVEPAQTIGKVASDPSPTTTPVPVPQSNAVAQSRLAEPKQSSTTLDGPRPMPATKIAATTQHRLAPGDSISLVVFGEADLSRENLRVTETGQVSFPLIGALDVAGKNTREVELLIQSRLSEGYVRDPKVSVSMYSYRPFFIRGAVRSPGVFDYSQGLTVSKALALAGGVTVNAQADGVSIERDGVVFMRDLDFDSQLVIESGDVVSVAGGVGNADASGAYIYLHGEVNQPGEYQFRRGLTVEKAIVLAGGFSMRASRKKITVTRYIDGQEKPDTIKKAELYLEIQPGDVIKVGASFF